MNRPVDELDREIEQPAQSAHWGRRLAEIRQANNITVSAVAAELRLEIKMVQQIEAEDLEQLPNAPFVKGYLRHYARMLDVDAAPILDAYSQVCGADAPGLTKVNRLHESTSKDAAPRSTTWIIVAVVVISVVVWWWTQLLSFKKTTEEVAIAEQARNASAILPESDGSNTNGAGGFELTLPQPQSSPQESAAPAQQAEPVATVAPAVTASATPLPTATQATIVLKFSQESWVDITDATGARLFVDLAKADSSRTVTGQPPFKVLLGNSAAVTIEYNGSSYDQRAHNSMGIARFTLGTAE